MTNFLASGIEINSGRHRTAVSNFASAGLAGFIDARLDDAIQEISKIEAPLDVVFIDALKSDNLKYLIVTPGWQGFSVSRVK